MQVNGFPQNFFPPLSILRTPSQGNEVESAQSRLRNPANASAKKSDVLLNAFSSQTEEIPSIRLNGPTAGFRVVDAINFLQVRSARNQVPAIANLSVSPRFDDLRLDRLDSIRSALRTLRNTASELNQDNALNIRGSSQSPRGFFEVETGNGSPLQRFSVTPQQVSSNRVLVSDPQSQPFRQLGLSGSFSINGFNVDVESTDSIVNIRNKINRGEDTNGNGSLDSNEDVDNDGVLETFQSPNTEFGPGVFIIEDRNGNGVIDPDEDTDQNFRLDGGTAATGVEASITGNRLKLENLDGETGAINLEDPDDVLLALGFFELNSKGVPIVKEVQLETNPVKSFNSGTQSAEILLDGERLTSRTNVFEDAIEDTRLTLSQSGDRAVDLEIFVDASSALSQISSLFESFNESITQINDALAFSQTFAQNSELQQIRQDLVLNTRDPLQQVSQRNQSIESISATRENRQAVGFQSTGTEKDTLNGFNVDNIVRKIRDGLLVPFQSTTENLLSKLSSIGIRNVDDDTFSISENELEKALTANSDEVLDLLKNPETGLIPVLEDELSRILNDLGSLEFLRIEVEEGANDTEGLSESFQRFLENSTFEAQVQTLITVV